MTLPLRIQGNISIWPMATCIQVWPLNTYITLIEVLNDYHLDKYWISINRSSSKITDKPVVWNSGIKLTNETGLTEVTLVNNLSKNASTDVPDGSTGICIFIQSQNELDLQKRTGFVVDHIDSILREWYRGKLIMFMLQCYSCLLLCISVLIMSILFWCQSYI